MRETDDKMIRLIN